MLQPIKSSVAPLRERTIATDIPKVCVVICAAIIRLSKGSHRFYRWKTCHTSEKWETVRVVCKGLIQTRRLVTLCGQPRVLTILECADAA
jgi:hypothetical protein